MTSSGSSYLYEYTITDHLGNARVSFADLDSDGEVVQAELLQTNHYYPFGIMHEGNQVPQQGAENMYKFNGTEHITDFDLDWNHTLFRTYDNALGRWHQIDPKHSERESPFVGLGNNPILYPDMLGDSIDPNRTRAMNFIIVPTFRGAKNDFVYRIDRFKAILMSIMSFGKLKVITADDSVDALKALEKKLGNDGYINNLTIDYHARRFGYQLLGDPVDNLEEYFFAVLSEDWKVAGEATTVYLGNCWAGGNENYGWKGENLTEGLHEALDGATVYGNQASASTRHFLFRNHFIGRYPAGYKKNDDINGNKKAANKPYIGFHTVTFRDIDGVSQTRIISSIIKIRNSGNIEDTNRSANMAPHPQGKDVCRDQSCKPTQ